MTKPMQWLALAASGPLAGCQREPSSPGAVESTGSIGFNLTAAPGVTLNSVTYTIGGNGFTKEYGIFDIYPLVRLLKTAPLNREMILNYIGEHVMGLPRSY